MKSGVTQFVEFNSDMNSKSFQINLKSPQQKLLQNLTSSALMLAVFFVVLCGTLTATALVSTAKAATKQNTTVSPYIKTVGVPKSMQKYVRVAFNGFFDPAGTSRMSARTHSYKKKKSKNAPPIKVYNAPTYSLGMKNYKGYIKTYNHKSGLDFDNGYNDDYYDREIETYRRKPSTAYRTMCVRLKDGFYWPINFSRYKSQFAKDRVKCQQSCSGKVRLFYYPSTSDKVEDMRDLKGRKYASLKTAFLYRKKYVKNANCKPKPWSKEAKSLHKQYAAIDTERKRKRHIALTKRAEKKRVAMIKRLARKVASKTARRHKARKRRRVARGYRRRKTAGYYKRKKYSYKY